jgi:hypothetical protein
MQAVLAQDDGTRAFQRGGDGRIRRRYVMATEFHPCRGRHAS